MNEAERWVRENSTARGSSWSLILALAIQAKGCVAISTTEWLIAEARISRRELFRSLFELCQAGELQKLTKERDPKRLRAFHFAKMNCARLSGLHHPLCPRKQSTVPDLRMGNGYCAKALLPFPQTEWKLAPNWLDEWEDHHRFDELRLLSLIDSKKLSTAEQKPFDWHRAEAIWQKARLEEWLKNHPEVPAKPKEDAMPKNVIVMRRKTA